ncbi:MAG: hypothetical protein RJQ07_06605 [Pseudomonadales bacterium]
MQQLISLMRRLDLIDQLQASPLHSLARTRSRQRQPLVCGWLLAGAAHASGLYLLDLGYLLAIPGATASVRSGPTARVNASRW